MLQLFEYSTYSGITPHICLVCSTPRTISCKFSLFFPLSSYPVVSYSFSIPQLFFPFLAFFPLQRLLPFISQKTSFHSKSSLRPSTLTATHQTSFPRLCCTLFAYDVVQLAPVDALPHPETGLPILSSNQSHNLVLYMLKSSRSLPLSRIPTPSLNSPVGFPAPAYSSLCRHSQGAFFHAVSSTQAIQDLHLDVFHIKKLVS